MSVEFRPLELNGLVLVTPKMFSDDRGFFVERFRQDLWAKYAPNHQGFIQDNYSWSHHNVLRGLHFQTDPAQGKLVTCTHGSILDVAVDIRLSSPTFGRHLKIELSGERPCWLWIPPGFAHGFRVLSLNGAGVVYKVDQSYAPKSEGSIRYDDPELAIDWGGGQPQLSAKDAKCGSFQDFVSANRVS